MKFKEALSLIGALPATLRFKFHYFPFKTAIKLPVITYNARFKKLGGKVKIEGEIHPGMIRLGNYGVSIYAEKGIVWENDGIVIFHGETMIRKGPAVSVGKDGILNIGKGVVSTCGLKVVPYNRVTIGDNCTTGWNVLISDNEFHTLKSSLSSDFVGHSVGEINIGAGTWIGSECRLFKDASVPERNTIASGTFMNRRADVQPNSVIGNTQPVKVLATDRYLDKYDNVPRSKRTSCESKATPSIRFNFIVKQRA